MEDLDTAVKAAEIAVEAVPLGSPDRHILLSRLGKLLGKRFKKSKAIVDLDRCIEATDMALNAVPPDHPDQVPLLVILGERLDKRFKRSKEMADLDRGIQTAEKALNAIPPGHPDRLGLLQSLGKRLGKRIKKRGALEDHNRAIEILDMAVETCSLDYAERPCLLGDLAKQFFKRFEKTEKRSDLDRAIETADEAINTIPLSSPDRADLVKNLGLWLNKRFSLTGTTEDLARSIEMINSAVDGAPVNSPDHTYLMAALGDMLGRRYLKTADPEDLNRAIELVNSAVEATPANDKYHSSYKILLASWLGIRFDRTGAPESLRRANEVVNLALEIPSTGQRGYLELLSYLGDRLAARFEETGDLGYLNQAVEATKMAIDSTAADHHSRFPWLVGKLGDLLSVRFHHIGWIGIGELNQAVDLITRALDETPDDKPTQQALSGLLGYWLGMRYLWTGPRDDLHRAIEVAETAVATVSNDDFARPSVLANLGAWLGERFQAMGSIKDIDRAIEVSNMAISVMPRDHFRRASALASLGDQLGRKYESTGAIEDLSRAIEVTTIAVDITHPDHHFQASWLGRLGVLLAIRFGRTGVTEDFEQSIACFRKGWSCENAGASARIRLAGQVADFLASLSKWEESSAFLQDAVKLLPKLSPRSFRNSDKQDMLASFAGLASMAAAVSLNAGQEARRTVELLELGRGVTTGLLLEMRADVSDLESRHPELAQEFVSLRDRLDTPIDDSSLIAPHEKLSTTESQDKQRNEAGKKFDEVIKKIRAQSGFHDFLLPHTAAELMAAAERDSIVLINVSPYRCDAFLITKDEIKAVKLDKLRYSDLKRKIRKWKSARHSLTMILEWLWDVLAHPILEALELDPAPPDDELPHIWWIPTGLLGNLPLHAAGYHFEGSTRTVLGRAMSSYSSSIKAILQGRRNARHKPAISALEHAVLVAMQTTPNLGKDSVLSAPTAEVKVVRELCPSLDLKPLEPARLRKDVLTHLPTCEVFHFAGHGRSHPREPWRSCLLLDDWEDSPLTVECLLDQKLQRNPPFLAYLSACSTGTVRANEFVDEGVNLISACQLAGFRHVVGTLWQVSDRHSVKVAKAFYEYMKKHGMNDSVVYRGLHEAVKSLRDRSDIDGTAPQWRNAERADLDMGRRVENPDLWACYVHFGS